MAGLKAGKNLILPRADKIHDPEAKRVIKEILKVLQEMNNTYYSDIVYVEGRVTTLEP